VAALSAKGYRVFAGAREPDRLAGAAGHDAAVVPVRLDVTDPRSVADAVAAVTDVTDGLYAVVNNAGVIVQGPLELVPRAELRRQFDVNVHGPALVTQAFLPLLRAGHGRLVNVTAATARVPGPYFGPISASKAALAALSDALRLELGHWGIPVVVLEPGGFATGIFDDAEAAQERARASMPPELVALYARQQQAVDRAMAAARRKAAAPSVLADALVKALEAERPKPRYTVGDDVRLLGLLARLPLRTRDRLMAQVTGLAKLKAGAN
jgi:NAD(P)-dependent dehydrogenase (short-subunit alcohol dehydrogenase family)